MCEYYLFVLLCCAILLTGFHTFNFSLLPAMMTFRDTDVQSPEAFKFDTMLK